MYGRDKARRIPFIIHQAAQGDFAPFLHEAISPSISDFIADGMYLSVTCAEDTPFIDQAEAARLNEDPLLVTTVCFSKPAPVVYGRKERYRPIITTPSRRMSRC